MPPLVVSSMIFSHPVRFRATRCKSRFCSVVETLARPIIVLHRDAARVKDRTAERDAHHNRGSTLRTSLASRTLREGGAKATRHRNHRLLVGTTTMDGGRNRIVAGHEAREAG